jgi:hypothetical protein
LGGDLRVADAINLFRESLPFRLRLGNVSGEEIKNRLAIDRPIGKRGFPGRET